jgi:tetratricopeptide (TPR) repeat protein
MMVTSVLRWLALIVLALSTSMPWRPLQAATEGTTKHVAIVPFGLPSWGTDRDWISDGFPYVLALRLQNVPQIKATVLPRSVLSSPQGMANVLDSAGVSKMLERLQPQGYEAVIFGNVVQVEPNLRVEIQVWATRPDRLLSKTQEQAAERDPDGLVVKLAGFVMSALQLPVSEAEGRRVMERYTASAEAFERFARALRLADLAKDEEEVAQAVSLFKEAVKLDGRFSAAWRQQGDLLFRRGHFLDAAEAYQAVLNLGRRSATVYRLLGNAYFARQDVPRAIDAYKRALQHEARDYQSLLDLGLAYAAVKDFENATKTFLRALESKPDDPLAFANLGVVYFLQGNFAAATASLRRAQLAHGSDPILTYNLGLSLLFEGAYDQARDQFERALQLKPDYAAAAYQLALIYERFNAVQAVERWRKYLDQARGKPGEQPWLTWAEEHLQHLPQPSSR